MNQSATNFTVSFVFMPNEFAQKMSDFLNKWNKVDVTLQVDTSRFDWSLIVIWFVAILVVFFGALWTKHELKIR